MNANELPADQLADLLDEIPVGDFESLDHHHFTRQAATMLRQQQAEINTLRTHGYKTQYELLRLEFLQQQAEIDRLTMLCDCMTTESNRKGNEIEALKKQIPDLENINKPNPFIGNLDKEPHAYKMGDIDWTKALIEKAQEK